MSRNASWLDAAPPHWTRKKLKYVASLRSGEGITADEIAPTGDYPVYGGNGLRGYTSAYTHEGDRVLIGRQGALCGNVNYASGRFWASEHAVVAELRGDGDVRWLGELLRAMDLGQYSQSAAQPGLAVDVIANLEIPVPPVDEQRAMADYLVRETAQLDALVAAKEKLLATLAEKQRALVTRAVTCGVGEKGPVQTTEVPWLGKIPAHWHVHRLKWSISSVVSGVWGDEPDGVNDIVCVRVADFDRDRLTVSASPPTQRSVPVRDRRGRLLQPGDLLLEKSGGGENQPVGRVVLFDQQYEAVCSNFVARVVLREGMYAPYWLYVHASLYDKRLNVVSTKQTTGIQNLDIQAYFDLQVPFPPYEEQRAIAHSIAEETRYIDDLRTATEDTISTLRERRATLANEVVRGILKILAHAR